MAILNFLMLTIGLLQFPACSSPNKSDDLKTDMINKTQSWEVLVSGTQCGVYEPKQALVKSQEEFDKLWAQTQNGIYMSPEKPKVDFLKKWVIAGYLGTVNTGGHQIEIKSIETGSEKTLVIFRHKKPGPDCFTTQAIEFPYLMVLVDHFKPETVEFKVVVETYKCE